MASKSNFFAYTDADGVDVVVQHLADVPEQYRAQARQLDLSKPAKTASVGGGEGDDSAHGAASPTPAAADGRQGIAAAFYGPSFVMGAVTAVAIGLTVWLAFRRMHRVLSLALAALIMAALGLGYLAYVRHQAGLPPAGLTTPAVLIDDARSAAGAIDKRHNKQDQEIREIEEHR